MGPFLKIEEAISKYSSTVCVSIKVEFLKMGGENYLA